MRGTFCFAVGSLLVLLVALPPHTNLDFIIAVLAIANFGFAWAAR